MNCQRGDEFTWGLPCRASNKRERTPALRRARRRPLGAARPGGDPAAAWIRLWVGGYGVKHAGASGFARGKHTHVAAVLAVPELRESWRAHVRHPRAPQEEAKPENAPAHSRLPGSINFCENTVRSVQPA